MSKTLITQEHYLAPSDPGKDAPHDMGLSVEEAASRLGVCRRLVFELIRQDRLHSITIGRRRIIPASSISALLRAAQA